MSHIKRADVLRQLKADLIGKDSYRGVTLTYSWLANQFGHFSLGFIPALILFSCIIKCDVLLNFFHLSGYVHCPIIRNPQLFSAAAISILWLCFELYNFLGPLLLKEIQKSRTVFKKGIKYTFQPSWWNVAFDTFTDVCFFTSGAFSAGLLLSFSAGLHFQTYRPILFIWIAVWIILIYPICYWFLTKMYLQAAQYPFQFRLSQWDNSITEGDKRIVYDFLSNPKKGRHLFIYGSKDSGKTGISVGIGTEMSIRHHTCVYTTAMKLYNMFEKEKRQSSDPKILWTWRDSSLLVIDDVNPCYPPDIEKELVTPEVFLQFLDTFSEANHENREIIRKKNVIWVLGNECTDSMHGKWREMLKQIGVSDDDIAAINLRISG